MDTNTGKESLIASITKQSQKLSVLKSEINKVVTNQCTWVNEHSDLDSQVKTY